MIRVKISSFIRRHKEKLKDLGQKLIIVAMVVFVATIIVSSFSGLENNNQQGDTGNVFKPTQPIIKGENVSKEQYEEDYNLVNTFLQFCNERKVEDAYNLLSNECKTEIYPTLETFTNRYYNTIFNRKREFVLQAWISTKNYIVYRIRYTNNMLATGTYDENDVYQDYITLNRKTDTEKISLGNFVDAEYYNIVTETEEIKATVTKRILCTAYEEYEIKFKNKTEKTILLNNLKNSATIKLITEHGTEYNAQTTKIFLNDLIIAPGEVITISIRFKKSISADNVSKEIQLLDIIKDYETYIQNEDIYTDMAKITIKVED